MTLFPQLLLDVHDELIVDLFAGGGGASVGIELATGRQVDIAINHDDAAVAMHRKNHPQTDHHVSDVFEVDPREVTNGRPIGLLWASPDCTFYSKARGGKPIRSEQKKRRALAWVVKRWAGQVRPRVIFMENVEEFAEWGPLVGPPDDLQPCPKKKGRRFRKFVSDLEDMGYEVERRELRACDYGAPTIRKRLFLVARCDGEPIVWPEPTHGPDTNRPYRTAAECIDWTYPMLSIFATAEEAKLWARARRKEGWKMGTPRRPLADATMRRIARGVVKYVLEAPEPFIVPMQNAGSAASNPGSEPLRTITAYPKGGGFAVAAPYLIPRYGERKGQAPRVLDITEPHPVVVPTGNGASLVASYLARHWGGMTGRELTEPHPTVLTKGAQDQLVAAHIQRDFGESTGHDAGEPLGTVTPGGGGKAAVVASFIQKYYGEGIGQGVGEPAPTVTTKDRMGLVTVELDGEPWVIVDIAMRMLQPRELYRAQGFPDSYVIDRGADGRKLTKTEQVRMVGNSVSPPVAAALVRANVPALIARDEAREAVA